MGDKKISQMAAATSIEDGDVIPLVRGGQNYKALLGSMASQSADDYTPTSALTASTISYDNSGGPITVGNSQAAIDQMLGFFDLSNVALYGASLDGDTDDTDAIEAAIEATGGFTIPAGRTCGISRPVVLYASNQFAFIHGNLKRLSGTFTGNEMIRVEHATTGSIVSRFKIIVSGKIDCNLNTTTGEGIPYGINVVFARWSSVQMMNAGTIIGAKTHPLYVGSSDSSTSYEVNAFNVNAILHETQTGTPYTNEANSVGIYYKNASDSVIFSCNPVGYRVGILHDGPSIFVCASHPWTRYQYHGPMTCGIWHNGTTSSDFDCYVDTPVDGSNPAYCIRVSKKNCRSSSAKFFNNPSYGSSGKLIGYYIDQGGSNFVAENPLFSSSENSAYKFKAYYAGPDASYLRTVTIRDLQSDKMVVDLATSFDLIPQQGKNLVSIYDDFTGVSIDTAKWAALLGSNGSCAAVVVESAANGFSGQLKLTTGIDAGGTIALNGVQVSSGINFKPSNGRIRLSTKVTNSSNGNVYIAFGLTDQRAALEAPITITGTTAAANASDAAVFVLDSSATGVYWKGVAVAGGIVSAIQDSNVAGSTGTQRFLEIIIETNGDVCFTLDGVQVGSVLSAAITPSVALCLVAAAYSKSSTGKTVSFDSFYISQELDR